MVEQIDEEKIIKDKKEYMKKYYESNKDKIIERSRARYKLKHKDVEKKKCIKDKKEYMKNYYKQNKDKIIERSSNRYKLKKEINVFLDELNQRHE